MLTTTLAILTVLAMAAAMALHLFGLPANWVVVGLALVWVIFSSAMTWGTVAVLTALGLVGEVGETLMVHLWGKKYGGSGKGSIGGMVGAFVGAILGAPFFFGLGAFVGALAGAFGGSLAVELLRGLSVKDAGRASWGAMLGRFGGTIFKAAVGFAMIVVAARHLFSA